MKICFIIDGFSMTCAVTSFCNKKTNVQSKMCHQFLALVPVYVNMFICLHGFMGPITSLTFMRLCMHQAERLFVDDE